MSLNRPQKMTFGYGGWPNSINRGSPHPVRMNEEDVRSGSSRHDPTKEGHFETAAASNKFEPESPKLKNDFPIEGSSQTPRHKRKRSGQCFQEEIAKLKRHLATKDKTIAELQSQEGKLKEQIAELQRYFKEEEKPLTARRESQQRRIQGLLEATDKEIEKLIEEKDDRQRRIQDFLAKADTEIQTLEAEEEEQEDQLRKAQESAFRQMKAGRWAPREDSSIRSDIKKLEARIRNWAKTYSCTDMRCFDTLSSKEISQVERLLHNDICAPDETVQAALKRWSVGPKVPMLVVHAVIANLLFHKILGQPFHLFNQFRLATGKGISGGRYSPYFGSGLKILYETMQQIDLQEAHTWRSQTLRLLHSKGGDSDASRETEKMSAVVCRLVAEYILDGPVFKLCNKVSAEEHDKRERELIELFTDAGALAQELWTQRSCMSVIDKGRLERFSVDSPLMEAHRLQKLDEGDHRFDGHEIVAVIQPALLAWGDDDGENYDNHKVWSKAIVLVAE